MRKVLIRLFKIFVSVSLMVLLVDRVGAIKLFNALKEVDFLWFSGALALFTSSHFLGSLQWWLMLQAEEVRIPYRQVLRYYFIGLFFNNFFIGGVGGDVSRIMEIRNCSKNSAAAVSTVFLDRIMGLLVLSSLAVLSSPFYLLNNTGGLRYKWFMIFLIVAWIVTFLVLFSRRIARPLAWGLQRFASEKIHLRAKEVYCNIHAFGRHKSLFMQVLGISLVVQLARIFMHFFVGRSIGIAVSPLYFVSFIPIIAILAAMPISLGGIGVREQSAVLLFAKAGIGAAQAFSMEFLAFLTAILSSLAGGVLFVLRKNSQPASAKERMNFGR